MFHFTKNLSKANPNILPATGLHPELVQERYSELSLILEKIVDEKYIGEIGLDYSNKHSLDARKLQRKAFEKILHKCSEIQNRVISIHSRRASSDVIDLVGKNFAGTVILHWYSGSLSDLKKALVYDFYFSVNPAMVSSYSGQNIISRIPADRILTETDGPFLELDNEPAEPHNLNNVIEYLSKIWRIGLDEVNSQIRINIFSADILP